MCVAETVLSPGRAINTDYEIQTHVYPQQYMFKSNLQMHMYKQELDILQHTRFLVFCYCCFPHVFVFINFLNKDRFGIEISYCFKQINIFF